MRRSSMGQDALAFTLGTRVRIPSVAPTCSRQLDGTVPPKDRVVGSNPTGSAKFVLDFRPRLEYSTFEFDDLI